MFAYQNVAQEICDRFDGGKDSASHYIPSERELAGLFKCSRVTVRAALESLEAGGRIARFAGKGTMLLEEGSALLSADLPRTAHTQLACVVLNGADEMAFYGQLLGGLRESLPSDWVVSLWEIDTRSGAGETQRAGFLEACDAYVIIGDYDRKDLVWFCKRKKPMLVLGWAADDTLREMAHSYVQIHFDSRGAFEKATDYLLSSGYHRPAVVMGQGHRGWHEIWRGIDDGMRRHGRTAKDAIRVEIALRHANGQPGYHQIRRAIGRLLDRGGFDCLITPMYAELLGEAKRRGLCIPEDLAVIVCSSWQDWMLRELEMTEICADHRLLGKVGELLVRSAADALSRSSDMSMPCEFVVRRSCPPVRTENRGAGTKRKPKRSKGG